MKLLDAEFLVSAHAASDLPPPTFAEVAFAGRSNVGKSSLINALLGRRKLAHTSSTPGRTRSINLFQVRLSDAVLRFVDLPGYGYAKRSKSERRAWGPLVERFLTSRDNLRAVVVIVDIRRGVQEQDQQLLDFLEQLRLAPILVATKIDKLASSKRKPALARLAQRAERPVLGFSAVTSDGRDALFAALLEKTVGTE